MSTNARQRPHATVSMSRSKHILALRHRRAEARLRYTKEIKLSRFKLITMIFAE
ncbi:unnamed protein product [Trichogramma brassicae]|uniref:Uncharacterized protein n=1 Tax=Trichogramma brassicae TaxID=86971 RepID=A0A6H5IA13_9HYME|nr:unnamed protein product [Trichogramma brassicae]